MLVELAVADLGVIAETTVVLASGMTALTGETGAGKTMIVEAVDLLVGGRADGTVVRAGAAEAVVEGRFVVADDEVVLRRVVPREGRSRAYVNGRLATVGELAEWGRRLVDLHGQHAHQSLLSAAVQRGALDRFGGIDLEPLATARKELALVDERLAALGGDERERARELDLLRFQVGELEAAGLTDADEDERLAAEEELLADAVGHRQAAEVARGALAIDGGAAELLGVGLGAMAERPPFAEIEARLRSVIAEVADLSADLRQLQDTIDDDPERVAALRQRRQTLADLRRKYGDTLADVLAYWSEAADRLAALEARDATAAALDHERTVRIEAVRQAEQVVGRARRKAAPKLAKAVQANLAELGLDKARLAVEVGDDPGDEVTFLLAANPGSPPQPLTKVASGGELARTMLALRLVLSEAPDTLVFDEVDAGVGGAAAAAVGRALAALGGDHQVLVVTHLAQVAAQADQHLVVHKDVRAGQTFTSVAPVSSADRVREVARMLSGDPDSTAARRHAAELLGRRGLPEPGA